MNLPTAHDTLCNTIHSKGITHRLIAIVSVALVLTISPLAIAQVSRVLIGFEDRPQGTPIFNQYRGVTFVGGDASPSPIVIIRPPLGTISGLQAVQAALFHGEFHGSSLVLRFDQRQHQVKLSTGLVQSSPIPLAATLRGFSDATATALVAQSATIPLGTAATTIDNSLQVNSSSGNILSVTLSLVIATNSSTGPDAFPIVIDNLEYDRPTTPPPRDTTAPLITITDPTEQQQIQGTFPGLVVTAVAGSIEETALRSTTISVNGRGPVPLDFFGGATGNYEFSMTLSSADGVVSGPNTVTVTAIDFAGNRATVTRHFAFTPAMVPPPSAFDIVPAAVHVTQGSGFKTADFIYQFGSGRELFLRNRAGTIRLVNGKSTLVRIYAAVIRSSLAIANVPAVLFVSKDNCTSNCFFNNNRPLPPMNNGTFPNLTGITIFPAGQPGADPQVAVADLSKSWNFLIPESWTNQDLVLTIVLNSGRYGPFGDRPSVPECESGVINECRDNNTVRVHLSFDSAKTVTFDPILVTFAGTVLRPTNAQVGAVLAKLNQLYPSQVLLGTTRNITLDQNLDDGDMLDEIQDRFGCGDWGIACGYDERRFEVGLLPSPYPGAPGDAGLSNRGNGAFWALAADTVAVAHEMGHAIGFQHAGCSHGEDSGGGCDSFFPIPHGGTGGYGFDFTAWNLIPPGDPSTPVAHAHDFMSYGHGRDRSACKCGGSCPTASCSTAEWTSTYMWDITIDSSFVDSVHYHVCSLDPLLFSIRCGQQLVPSSMVLLPPPVPSPQPALLVSGRIAPDGTGKLRPSYAVNVTSVRPSPLEPGDVYTVTALDARGNTLALKSFLPRPRENRSSTFNEILVLPPGRAVARIELSLHGVLLDSRTSQAGPISVLITAPVGDDHWQPNEIRHVSWTATSAGNVPLMALIEYSPDGGANFISLKRDVVENSLDVNVNELPPSTDARIRVQVTDGVNSGTATSHAFRVDPKPPSVLILKPTAGVKVPEHLLVEFAGQTSDLGETLPDKALMWYSNLSGTLGVGRQITVADLKQGIHTVTLTATSSHGQTASATVVIEVVAAGAPYQTTSQQRP